MIAKSTRMQYSVSSSQNAEENVEKPSVVFSIPMLPPSVNHYVEHPAQGVHRKSAAAKAWERDWPLFAKGQFVQGERFFVAIRYTFGPRDRFDVDNLNKMVLDCISKSGMLRDMKGKWLSDAWIKYMTVEIRDSKDDRKTGPKTDVEIAAIEGRKDA